MRPRVLFLSVVVTAIAVAGVATAVALGSRGRRLVDPPLQSRIDCPASALGGSLPTVVYLPGGYRPYGRPLPVVYFLHGLPAGPETYTQYGFVADALAAAHRRAIVVAPQGAPTADSDQEYLDWSPHDDWPEAIAHQLVTCIDDHFDAIRSRRGRALVGLSAGAYGAFNIGLRNLATYGAVEAWSGYFAATNPAGTAYLTFRTAAETAAARVWRGPSLKAELRRHPSLIGFYVGRSDDRFAEDNAVFDRQLTAAGISHVYRTYPGGHSTSLWSAHAAGWLRMALVYLANRRVVAP